MRRIFDDFDDVMETGGHSSNAVFLSKALKFGSLSLSSWLQIGLGSSAPLGSSFI